MRALLAALVLAQETNTSSNDTFAGVLLCERICLTWSASFYMINAPLKM